MGLCPGVNSCLSTSRLCDVSHLLFIITCSYCILQLPDLYTLTCPKLSFAAFDLLRGEIFWSLSAKFRRSSPAPFLKRNCMWPHFLLLCALGVAWREENRIVHLCFVQFFGTSNWFSMIQPFNIFNCATCNSLRHQGTGSRLLTLSGAAAALRFLVSTSSNSLYFPLTSCKPAN